ncbi:hypothetical protein [Desulfonatronum thioautotrophicum]|uniref:hypothetical protein n=1 Tax=Desulfonatronum thioautotrophicum TaxID=617001 RepID=UPI0012947D09|nr:hypothetical protein [Desulfonatronum thioautotrophicum]
MDTMFRMRTRKSMNNLHVRLEGVFDPDSATSLALALREEATGCERFFINTDGLERVEPQGVLALKDFMRGTVPGSGENMASRIYFKGKNGNAMALEGQRILQIKAKSKTGCGCSGTCGCAGKCVVCKCAVSRERVRHNNGNE